MKSSDSLINKWTNRQKVCFSEMGTNDQSTHTHSMNTFNIQGAAYQNYIEFHFTL